MYKILLMISILIVGLESKVSGPLVAYLYMQESKVDQKKIELKVIGFKASIPKKGIVVRSEGFVHLLKNTSAKEEAIRSLTSDRFIQKNLLGIEDPRLKSYWYRYRGKTLKYSSHEYFKVKKYNSVFNNFRLTNIEFSKMERIMLVEFNMGKVTLGFSDFLDYVEFDVVFFIIEGDLVTGKLKKYKIDHRTLRVEFKKIKETVGGKVEEEAMESIEEETKEERKIEVVGNVIDETLVSILKKKKIEKPKKKVGFNLDVEIREIPNLLENEKETNVETSNSPNSSENEEEFSDSPNFSENKKATSVLFPFPSRFAPIGENIEEIKKNPLRRMYNNLVKIK